MTLERSGAVRIAAVLAFMLAVAGVAPRWNATVPAVLANPRGLDCPQALALVLLCRLLIVGLPRRGGRHARRPWAEWEGRPPEERERLRHGVRRHREG